MKRGNRIRRRRLTPDELEEQNRQREAGEKAKKDAELAMSPEEKRGREREKLLEWLQKEEERLHENVEDVDWRRNENTVKAEMQGEHRTLRALLIIGSRTAFPERLKRSNDIPIDWPLLPFSGLASVFSWHLPKRLWIPESADLIERSQSPEYSVEEQAMFLCTNDPKEYGIEEPGRPCWLPDPKLGSRFNHVAESVIRHLMPSLCIELDQSADVSMQNNSWAVLSALMFSAFWNDAVHENVCFDQDFQFEYSDRLGGWKRELGVHPDSAIKPQSRNNIEDRNRRMVLLPGCRCVELGVSVFKAAADLLRMDEARLSQVLQNFGRFGNVSPKPKNTGDQTPDNELSEFLRETTATQVREIVKFLMEQEGMICKRDELPNVGTLEQPDTSRQALYRTNKALSGFKWKGVKWALDYGNKETVALVPSKRDKSVTTT